MKYICKIRLKDICKDFSNEVYPISLLVIDKDLFRISCNDITIAYVRFSEYEWRIDSSFKIPIRIMIKINNFLERYACKYSETQKRINNLFEIIFKDDLYIWYRGHLKYYTEWNDSENDELWDIVCEWAMGYEDEFNYIFSDGKSIRVNLKTENFNITFNENK